MKKCKEQEYYDRAIFYGSCYYSVDTHTKPASYHKIWLMFIGLIESADMIKHNNDK